VIPIHSRTAFSPTSRPVSGRRNVVIQEPLWQLLPKGIVRASEYEGKLFNQSSYLRRALLNQLRADGVDTGDALAALGNPA
jgi:hypothetical protein